MKCEYCAKEVTKDSDYERCYICQATFCNSCLTSGICPTDWERLPPNAQLGISTLVTRRKRFRAILFGILTPIMAVYPFLLPLIIRDWIVWLVLVLIIDVMFFFVGVKIEKFINTQLLKNIKRVKDNIHLD